MTHPLIIEPRGPVTLLRLNRPERRNALSPELIEALWSALDALPPACRAVVITGQGDRFCAGGDLGGGGLLEAGFLDQHAGRQRFGSLLQRMAESPVPLIAAVNGEALGGGFGLAAACHLIVADERASFALPELRLGLFPHIISPVLARNLPRKLIHELILTGRRLSPEEGRAHGFVNEVAPADGAVEAAVRMASLIAERSPAIVGLGLKAMAAVEDATLPVAIAHMASQLTINLLTEDAAEGISAFFARRPPEWKGR
jgi:enoyl-CoA hydratase